MTRTSTDPRRFAGTLVAAMLAGGMILSSCGSDAADPATGQSLPEPVDTAAPTTGTDEPGEVPVDTAPPVDGKVIGTASMGGTVVDPRPHLIDSYAILESYPEQIQVSFTAGDPNCTAAEVRAVATDTVVRLELVVGITEDALTRSCEAGDVEHLRNVALDEPLNGRAVSIGE